MPNGNTQSHGLTAAQILDPCNLRGEGIERRIQAAAKVGSSEEMRRVVQACALEVRDYWSIDEITVTYLYGSTHYTREQAREAALADLRGLDLHDFDEDDYPPEDTRAAAHLAVLATDANPCEVVGRAVSDVLRLLALERPEVRAVEDFKARAAEAVGELETLERIAAEVVAESRAEVEGELLQTLCAVVRGERH